MYPEVRAVPFELDSEFCTSKYTLVQGPRAPLELTRNSSKGTIELTSFHCIYMYMYYSIHIYTCTVHMVPHAQLLMLLTHGDKRCPHFGEMFVGPA